MRNLEPPRPSPAKVLTLLNIQSLAPVSMRTYNQVGSDLLEALPLKMALELQRERQAIEGKINATV